MILCWLGRHRMRWLPVGQERWRFLGTLWTTERCVEACTRCGKEAAS